MCYTVNLQSFIAILEIFKSQLSGIRAHLWVTLRVKVFEVQSCYKVLHSNEDQDPK